MKTTLSVEKVGRSGPGDSVILNHRYMQMHVFCEYTQMDWTLNTLDFMQVWLYRTARAVLRHTDILRMDLILSR